MPTQVRIFIGQLEVHGELFDTDCARDIRNKPVSFQVKEFD